MLSIQLFGMWIVAYRCTSTWLRGRVVCTASGSSRIRTGWMRPPMSSRKVSTSNPDKPAGNSSPSLRPLPDSGSHSFAYCALVIGVHCATWVTSSHWFQIWFDTFTFFPWHSTSLEFASIFRIRMILFNHLAFLYRSIALEILFESSFKSIWIRPSLRSEISKNHFGAVRWRWPSKSVLRPNPSPKRLVLDSYIVIILRSIN